MLATEQKGENMERINKNNAKYLGSLGGKAKARNRRQQEKELEGMTFTEIVNKYTTAEDLKKLYDGLLRSGKKGSVKATELIIKYLDKKETEDINEFAL